MADGSLVAIVTGARSAIVMGTRHDASKLVATTPAAAANSDAWCFMAKVPRPQVRELRVKPIDDLRGIALEFAVHPQTSIVVPDAPGQIGRDEAVARRAKLTTGDRDLFIGQFAHADADHAAMLRIDHGRMLEHHRRPQVIRGQDAGRGDEGASLVDHAKALSRRRARDLQRLAMLYRLASQRGEPPVAPEFLRAMAERKHGE